MVYMEQQVAIDTFLSHHKVRPNKKIGSPMGDKNQLIKDQTPLVGAEINEFQSKLPVETMNYSALTTRYAIAYPAARISQFMSKPTRGASNALDRILSYLLATQDFKIKGVFAPKIDTVTIL